MKIYHKQFNLFYNEKRLQFNYSFNIYTTYQDLLEYVIKLFPNYTFCPCFKFTNMNNEIINNEILLSQSNDIYNDFKIKNVNKDNKCICSDNKTFYNKSKKEIIEYFSKKDKDKKEEIEKKDNLNQLNNNRNALEFYDIIIDIKSIKDITKGWEIKMSDRCLNKYNKYKKDKDKDVFIKIGVIGNANRGKSYLLSKIAGIDIPTGYSVKTEGLCFKYEELFKYRDAKCIFMDSVGLDSTELKNEEEDKDKNKNEIENDELVTKLFLENYLIYNSDIPILVLGPLTYSEQKILNRIKNLIKEQKDKKPLYIIHNLKNFSSIEEVMEYIGNTLLKKIPLEKRLNITAKRKDDEKGVFYYEKNSSLIIYHLIYAKEASKAGDYQNILNVLKMQIFLL